MIFVFYNWIWMVYYFFNEIFKNLILLLVRYGRVKIWCEKLIMIINILILIMVNKFGI